MLTTPVKPNGSPLTRSKPLVERFFKWVDQQLARPDFTPSNRNIETLNYVHGLRLGLEVFLTEPDILVEANYLERAFVSPPMRMSR
jgi:transposase